MKKNKLKIVFAVILVVIAACALFACGGNVEPEIKQFDSNVKLEGKEVTYDGSEQELRLSGNLPAGATTTYENNGQTDAGEYTVKVTVSCEGYETKTYTAKLKINKADFKMDGIEFKGKTFFYKAGTERKVELTDGDNETVTESDFPDGTEIKYTENKKIAGGKYSATVTIENKNYNTVTLENDWIIATIADIVDSVKKAVKNSPTPLKFLPQALQPENMSVGTTAPSYDFANSFVNVAAIDKRYIGKQLNVVYDLIENSEKVFKTANLVNSVLNSVALSVENVLGAVTDIDFEKGAAYDISVGAIKAKLLLNGNVTGVLIGTENVNAEVYYDWNKGESAGRMQVVLAGDLFGSSVKYVSTDDYLSLAYCSDIKSTAASMKQLEFTRQNGVVAGYLYEYIGLVDYEIDSSKNKFGMRSSAVIRSDAKTTTIMSDKRETDDLIIRGYEEVYDSATGRYLGGEVDETVKAKDYDTFWFNIYDVKNFVNTIKAENKANGINLNTIYINGSKKDIGSMNISYLNTSRRFDIEMKDVYYFVENADGEIERVKNSVPMLFVQNHVYDAKKNDTCISRFPAHWIKENENNGALTDAPVLPSTTLITAYYQPMKTTFTAVKENISYASIKATIGQPNAFFTSTAE